jgi:hypothetical protein
MAHLPASLLCPPSCPSCPPSLLTPTSLQGRRAAFCLGSSNCHLQSDNKIRPSNLIANFCTFLSILYKTAGKLVVFEGLLHVGWWANCININSDQSQISCSKIYKSTSRHHLQSGIRGVGPASLLSTTSLLITTSRPASCAACCGLRYVAISSRDCLVCSTLSKLVFVSILVFIRSLHC